MIDLWVVFNKDSVVICSYKSEDLANHICDVLNDETDGGYYVSAIDLIEM